MHLNEINLIISGAAGNAVNMSTCTLKVTSQAVQAQVQTLLSKPSSKMICVLAVCIAFTATAIHLQDTLTSKNIDHERA